MTALKNIVPPTMTTQYLRHNGVHVAAIIGPKDTILQVWAAVPGCRELQSDYALAHDLVYNRSSVEPSSVGSFREYCHQNNIKPTIPADNTKALRVIFGLAKDHPDMFITMPKEKAASPAATQPSFYSAPGLRHSA